MKLNCSITLVAFFCFMFSVSLADAYVEKCKSMALQAGCYIKNNKIPCAVYLATAGVFLKYVKDVYECRDKDYWRKWRWCEKYSKDVFKFDPRRLEFKNLKEALIAIICSNRNKILWNALYDSMECVYWQDKYDADKTKFNNINKSLRESWQYAITFLKNLNRDQVAQIYSKLFSALTILKEDNLKSFICALQTQNFDGITVSDSSTKDDLFDILTKIAINENKSKLDAVLKELKKN